MKFPWSKSESVPAPEVKSSATTTLTDPLAYELFGGGPVTTAGATVTPQSAMRCTAVRAAVLAISEALGTLPVNVFRRNDDGSKERDVNHPIEPLLQTAANDWLSASEFKSQMTRDALLHGNAFAQIIRVDGKPYAIDRLTPGAGVQVTVDTLTGEPRYAINGQRVARSDIFHLRAPAILHTHIAESPVMQCREAIGVALAIEKHVGNLFKNGARPGGYLKSAAALGDKAVSRLLAALRSMFGPDGSNASGTAVFEQAEFIPLTFSSVDAQTIELWRNAVVEIARALRVPQHMIGELGRATWSNVESLGLEFTQYDLAPWIKRWEDEIALKLFSDDERRTHFARFDTSDFLKADMAGFAQAMTQLIAARILNPNEARAKMDLPPYPGGDKFENPNTLSLSTTPKIPGVKDDANAA